MSTRGSGRVTWCWGTSPPPGPTRPVVRIILAKHETSDAARLKVFQDEAGQALLEASKCPDFVLDRGHWFAEHLTDDEKRQLKAFLKTL